MATVKSFSGLGSYLMRSLINEKYIDLEKTDSRIIQTIMGMAAVETNDFKSLEENLNYSSVANAKAAGIDKINKLSNAEIKKLLNNPRAFANAAYGNRVDLGNTEEGDGYKYRGRGFFQITGKANYESIAKKLNMPEIVDNPNLLSNPRIAAKATIAYIEMRGGKNKFKTFNSALSVINKNEPKNKRDNRRRIFKRYALEPGSGAKKFVEDKKRLINDPELIKLETNIVSKITKRYPGPSTENQMENLGLSSERSQTQSNPSEDKINENVDNLVDRFRSIVKEREPEGVFGGAFSVNPDGSITNNEAIDDQEADDVFPNTDTRDEQEAEDIYKFSIPKVERKDTSDSGGGFNIMSKAEASEQPNVSIDPISTDDMFKEMIKTLPRMAKTASKTKKQKIIESIREGLKTPEIEEVESPDIDQEMDRLLRDTSTMDERERAMLTSGMDPELLDDDPPKTEDDLRDASKEDLEAPFIVGTAEEDNRDAALGGDNLFKFDEGEDEDMQPMSFPEEQIDTTIDPFTEDDNLERERFTRQTEDEPEDSGDFSFFRSLFTNEDTDTDLFADEAQPLGGEADPNEDVLRFDEGGTADFDGKKEEDDEGDPPPLAKPEEVADDIPAMLSEGEYVLPANVVRYLGLERIMDMHRQVLSEIQQMEDLGMIQNVDKNGEPEEDDKEMKFLEPEEGEEAVSKGTLIIASSKPKGMMCPEPLMFNGGGTGTDNDDPDATDEQEGKGKGDTPGSGVADFGGVTGTEAKDREKAAEVTSIDEFNTKEELDKAKQKEKDMTELDRAYEASKKGFVEKGLYGLGKLGERMGVEVTEARAREREAAEAEASQPGDSDDDDINKLVDGDIKEEEIKTTGLEDLLDNNIYIEGVGYVPRSQAGLMSQTTV